MAQNIFWCSNCGIPIAKHRICPICSNDCQEISTNGICTPVYIQEKKLISKILGKDINNSNVWYLGKSSYLVEGKRVLVPYKQFYQEHKHEIFAEELRNDCESDDTVSNEKLFIYANSVYLKSLIYSAEEYVVNTMKQFESTHMATVSFSGGKDSTVVSRIVRDALQTDRIIHFFGDTTLEFPCTYSYVNADFRKENPIVPIIPSETENDFFKLCKVFGPPSKFERWCCTIFKTSNLNTEYQNLVANSLSFLGIRHSESKERKNYAQTQVRSKIGSQINAMPIIEWTDFDVWLYIVSKGISFNKAYRWGYKRVGCWCCPNNSDWSMMLTDIYYPELAKRWKETLYDFALRTHKNDVNDYVENGKWKTRKGASGLEVKNVNITDTPCNLSDRARNIIIKKKITRDVIEFFKPVGKLEIIDKKDACYITISECEMVEGEEILFPNRKLCDLVIVWGTNVIKVLPSDGTDALLLVNRLKCQLRKYQYCIRCSACDSICPYGAINTFGDKRYYVDETKCKQNLHACSKCIAKFYNGCITCQVLSERKSKSKDK